MDIRGSKGLQELLRCGESGSLSVPCLSLHGELSMPMRFPVVEERLAVERGWLSGFVGDNDVSPGMTRTAAIYDRETLIADFLFVFFPLPSRHSCY